MTYTSQMIHETDCGRDTYYGRDNYFVITFEKGEDINKIFRILYEEGRFEEKERVLAFLVANRLISDTSSFLRNAGENPNKPLQGFEFRAKFASDRLILIGDFTNTKGTHKNQLKFFLKLTEPIVLQIEFFNSIKKHVNNFLNPFGIVIDERSSLINDKTGLTITDRKSIWKIFTALLDLKKLEEFRERLNTILVEDLKLDRVLT